MWPALIAKLVGWLIASQQATLFFAGDAMMHQAQLDAARQPDGSYDYSVCFDEIKPWVTAADLAVVNLETPVGRSDFSGYPAFNAPPSWPAALRDAGFDLFLTANNHTLDRHSHGLHATLEILDSLRVAHLGTYADSAARAKALPMVLDVKGFRIAFLNYTYGTNGIEPTGSDVVDYINKSLIAADVEAARNAGAEIITVCIHWGDEYVLQPPERVRAMADYLVDLGVNIIIGSHPHVVQPDRWLTNPLTRTPVYLVYSLGNLISNMRTTDTRGGAVVTLTLRRDSLGRAYVAQAHPHLVFTVPPRGFPKGHPAHRNYSVVPLDSVPAPWRAQASAFAAPLPFK